MPYTIPLLVKCILIVLAVSSLVLIACMIDHVGPSPEKNPRLFAATVAVFAILILLLVIPGCSWIAYYLSPLLPILAAVWIYSIIRRRGP
ncbi:MAG: hypothetical protein WC107_06580 [Patescibacteria group bacterium]